MNRIAIIGDSNSISYFENDNSLTSMNNLYPFFLAEYGFDIVPMSFVSNNTEKIIKRSNFFLKNANSDYFILQIGWIDSSAKQYPNWLDSLIKLKIKGTKKLLQKLVSHYKKYYIKNYDPLISKKQFEKNLLEIIKLIKIYNLNSTIIFLTIPYSSDIHIDSYRIEYNKVITKVVEKLNCHIIDTYTLTKEKNMLNNSGHFSKEAHIEIAQKIKNWIDSNKNNEK